jgi:hypothetical protein
MEERGGSGAPRICQAEDVTVTRTNSAHCTRASRQPIGAMISSSCMLLCATLAVGCITMNGEAFAAAGRAQVQQQPPLDRANRARDRIRPQVTRASRASPRQVSRTQTAGSSVRAREERPTAVVGAEIRNALVSAARTSGVEPHLLFAMAWKESRFNPDARNRRSTALGLMQFTEATWLEVVRDHGQQHGLERFLAALETDHRTGVIRVTEPRLRSELLHLRRNPDLSARLAAERLRRNRSTLATSAGRPATAADLYMVHLLGPAGARRLLVARERTPRAPAARFATEDAVRANRNLFYRGAEAIGLAQFYAEVERLLEQQQAALRQAQLASSDASFSR